MLLKVKFGSQWVFQHVLEQLELLGLLLVLLHALFFLRKAFFLQCARTQENLFFFALVFLQPPFQPPFRSFNNLLIKPGLFGPPTLLQTFLHTNLLFGLQLLLLGFLEGHPQPRVSVGLDSTDDIEDSSGFLGRGVLVFVTHFLPFFAVQIALLRLYLKHVICSFRFCFKGFVLRWKS